MSRAKTLLVTGGYDHTIRFWDVSNGSMVKQLQARPAQPPLPASACMCIWWPALGPGTGAPAPLPCGTLHAGWQGCSTGPGGPCVSADVWRRLAVSGLADQRAADFARCAQACRTMRMLASD
jgi:hypothetical protein